jgi:RimJ/RimL family protein N-acetyltransferase
MNTTGIAIETENLVLCAISRDYAEEIFKEFTSEITTYMYPKPPEKIEETNEFIDVSMKENGMGVNFQGVVLHRLTKEFLGNAGIHNIHTKTPELGVWIKKSAHGNAFGKEAVTALKEWADTHLDYEYLLYPVGDANVPSRRIPESLGGKIFREYDEMNMSGRKLRILEYRIYPAEQ